MKIHFTPSPPQLELLVGNKNSVSMCSCIARMFFFKWLFQGSSVQKACCSMKTLCVCVCVCFPAYFSIELAWNNQTTGEQWKVKTFASSAVPATCQRTSLCLQAPTTWQWLNDLDCQLVVFSSSVVSGNPASDSVIGTSAGWWKSYFPNGYTESAGAKGQMWSDLFMLAIGTVSTLPFTQLFSKRQKLWPGIKSSNTSICEAQCRNHNTTARPMSKIL